MKLYESPYNFPSSSDLVNLKDLSTGSKDLHTHYAIGDKVKFKIGPTAEVDAYVYAVRFEAATVWYDLLFDPYVGTPDEGGYTILTNVRALMVHPQEFEQRIQRITESEAKRIKMKMYESKKKMKEASINDAPDTTGTVKAVSSGNKDLIVVDKNFQKYHLQKPHDFWPDDLRVNDKVEIFFNYKGGIVSSYTIKKLGAKSSFKENHDFEGRTFDDESETETIPEIEKGLSYIQRGLRQSGIRNLQDKERLIHCISDFIRTCDQNGGFTATSERKFQMFLSNM